MAKVGRPSSFSQAIGDEICEGLIEGRSLKSICANDDMPSASTVCRWLANNEEFRNQYASAREAQADTLADEIVDIADDKTFDTVTGADGIERANSEWITRSRLRVDARKWVAAKLKPKKYGDKVDVTSAGESLTGDLDPVARATRLAAIFASIEKRNGINEPD